MPRHLTREWIESADIDSLDPRGDLRLDFRDTERLDSSGASLLAMMNRAYHESDHHLVLANIAPRVLDTLSKWTARLPREAAPLERTRDPLLVRVGDAGLAFMSESLTALSVLTEIVYWSTLGMFKRRDFKKGSLGDEMYQLGFNALGIVALLAFLIGVVLALQTAMQLKLYGADIFLAPMIGISMIYELGPLMTAIILAGRTGSATTAEVATMGVQEELDALRTMSINPIQFVVVPKFWGISLTMPMLTIVADLTGIFGGFLVAVFYLQTASSLFITELMKNIFLKDVIAGLVKSVVFSWLIIWIGAYYGLKVRGGAEEVGRETTASVVTCIFIIILADAAFSFIL